MATKVAEAFVELTGRTDGVRKAFRDTEQLAKGTLGRIGKEISGLFGGLRAGVGLGGAVGAAGVGAFVAKAAKDFSTGTAQSLAQIAVRTARSGQSLEAQLQIIKSFSANEGGIIGASTKDITEAVGQISALGLSPKVTRQILRAGGALAVEGKTNLQAGVAALLDIPGGGNLKAFGQFSPPEEFPIDTLRRALVVNEAGFRRLERAGGITPGQESAVASKLFSDFANRLGKTALGLLPTSTAAERREAERLRRIRNLPANEGGNPDIGDRITEERAQEIFRNTRPQRDTPSLGALERMAGEVFDARIRAMNEAENEFFRAEVGTDQERQEAGAGPAQGLPGNIARQEATGAQTELIKTTKELDETMKEVRDEIRRNNDSGLEN